MEGSAMRLRIAALGLACAVAFTSLTAVAADRPHNVILFVPDGLRALMVNEQNAPAMAALRDQGVNFKNSHSLFPTFTTANASAMATGHYLGDTGDFSNTIYTGRPVTAANGSVTPFLESDPVLGEVDALFNGDYLDETTVLKAARDAGFGTAAIGKLGPVLIFDHTDRSGSPTIIIDDQTGTPNGIPLAPSVAEALAAAGLPAATPSRGENGKAGNATAPGTLTPNTVQQDYFTDVATKVVLPLLKQKDQPFVMVFWSRDPDGTQHNQGDSLGKLTPGINGPSSLAAIRNADNDLARLRQALTALGLADTTDIVVAADHGFSTISKESKTSVAARRTYADVTPGMMPPGTVAIDLAAALKLPLFDPDSKNAAVADDAHPKAGNGLIGKDPAQPQVVVAANGGSDLIYLPGRDKALARRIVDTLLAQDYVSGIFVDETLGKFAGTLPLGAIAFQGKAVTPHPAIVVSFRSVTTGCDQPTNCATLNSDTPLQQGQGMHGSFGRADTYNFMAAIGPDFKSGFVDPAPVSNADVGRTIAHILGLEIKAHGTLLGRVASEAMRDGKTPAVVTKIMRSEPAKNGLRTVLEYQLVGTTRYLDAAGFPGRTVGLDNKVKTAGR
jgi:hypothetical protein